jgi:dipeptidyl aminopeptidase/acylaminoacyl peptidase
VKTRHIPSLYQPRMMTAATLAVLLAFMLLLVACGGPEPTPQIVIVTATYTPQPQVVVVTATSSPAPRLVPSDTPPPQPATNTPAPTQPSASAGASVSGSTATLPATDTPIPIPPTATETPMPPSPTPTDPPTAKSSSLNSYFVVYTSYKGPDVQNYVLWGMNGDGSGAFEILSRASEPSFSPDGNKFAFYHWTDGLYIWDLVKESSMHVVGNTDAAFATWSPNGKRLAYCNLLGQAQLYIVNADGSENHSLTPGLRPSWSLQGGFIGYDSCENNKCGIFRINPDGGGKRQLTSDGGGGAAVSPDGKKIAYWSETDGDFEIFVVNADGSGRTQLTKNAGNDALPAWSPDGKAIYYLSDQNGKAWAVMAMNPNGSGQRKIMNVATSPDPLRGWQYQRISVTWNR